MLAAGLVLICPHAAKAQNVTIDGGATDTVIGSGGGTIASGSTVNTISIGPTSDGTLAISAGGTLTGTGLAVAGGGNTTAALTITGSSSELSIFNSGRIVIAGGAGSSARLSISDGGTFHRQTGSYLNPSLSFADGAGSSATIDVTGSGSLFRSFGVLRLGQSGSATMTLRNGATLRTNTSVTLANLAGSTGTLNIGAAEGSAAQAAGSVETGTLTGGAGTARVVFNHTGDGYTLDESLGGSIQVRVIAGTTSLTGTNSYTGGTGLLGGVLAVDGDGRLGATSGGLAFSGGTLRTTADFASGRSVSLSGTGGTVSPDAGTTATLSGTISGSGGLTKAGAGTLVLNAAASHGGGTTVSAGTLRLGAAERLPDAGALTVASGATFDLAGFDETIGSLAGAGSVELGAGQLTVGGDSGGFTGSFLGSGDFFKTGDGTFTLGEGSQFTGDTTISGGTLVVNGTAGPIFLRRGGTLGGSGTVGPVDAEGTVAPGNSIGTLSSGTITFRSGSVYAVEIADDGRADKLAVSGKAVVEPGASVEVTPEPGSYRRGQRYTIIETSDGIEGAFDAVDYAADSTLTFDLSLLTEGDDLVLLLGRNADSFEGIVTDPSLSGTAAGLDALESSVDPDEDALLQALYALDTGGAFDAAVRSLSGGGLAGGTQTALAGSQSVLQALSRGGSRSGASLAAGSAGLAQLALGDGAASDVLVPEVLASGSEQAASVGTAAVHGLWLQGVGGFGSRDGQDGVAGEDRRYAGVVGGLRGALAEDLTLGLALARVEGRSESDDGLLSSDSTSLMAALHGSWAPSEGTARGFRLDAALGLARHELESERRIRFAGFDETAEGDHVGYELLGDLGATWELSLGAVTLAPTAGLSASWLAEDGWQESGAGSANLAIDQTDSFSLQPRAGLGLSYRLDLDGGLDLTPRAQALWLGRLGDRRPGYAARFAGTATDWTVPGLDEPSHSAAISLGLELAGRDSWSLGAGYAGRFAGGARDHGFLAGGSLRF